MPPETDCAKLALEIVPRRYSLGKFILPSPTVTFGFILATLYGAAFHLIFGGDVRRLALFLLAGWFGFLVGHILGVAFEINLFNVGILRIVSATLGAVVALMMTHLLTSQRTLRR